MGKSKVVGIVGKHLNGGCCRIKVVALEQENKKIQLLSTEEATELFPGIGHVFGISFFTKYNFEEGDFIRFDYSVNTKLEEGDEGKDKYVLCGEVETYSVFKLFRLENQMDFKAEYVIDLQKLSIDFNGYEGDFYLYTDKYLIGKLRIKSGIISPAYKKRIRMWDLDTCLIYDGKKELRLLKEPESEYIVLDAMTNTQLFEWFRERIKEREVVKRLDEETEWRKYFPDLFGNVSTEDAELEKVRCERILKLWEEIDLNQKEIQSLINCSDEIKQLFQHNMQVYKEEYQREFDNELEDLKEEIENQKKIAEQQKNKWQKEIAQKEKMVSKLEGKIKELNNEVSYVVDNKQRLLQDFKFFQESALGTVGGKKSYLLEELIPEVKAVELLSRDEIERQLGGFLKERGQAVRDQDLLLDTFLYYKAMLVGDIGYGLALLDLVGKAKYMIRQVEPDWIHFEQLWDGGLGELWESCYACPDMIHLFILEDINLSAPECYARPLLDCISGVRRTIPYGATAFPDNLRIVATVAPVQMPEIGLPLYGMTYKNWGAWGFKQREKQEEIWEGKPIDNAWLSYGNFKILREEVRPRQLKTETNDELSVILEDK